MKHLFRVDGDFLSKLNFLILERYRDLNPETDKVVSHDEETLRSVEVSRTNSSNSADSENSELSEENNLKRITRENGFKTIP